ncbi:hypothetical protein ILUMI_01463 [Ignelater luminosus]|uniref:Major facilitator superfamily (MFS) profile domain-containing protein n=1 Tax=Ignelater luminosus TaxID=2038154 RepID=A0A8K0GHF1_IGNLU|nr:hypothetical protein ILUMI_01463 [Ignelater luminosus]
MKFILKISASTVNSEKSHQWPQFLAAFSATFLSVGSGFQNGWPSPSVPKLLSGDLGFEVAPEEVSYVVMIAPLGFLIGSPITGFLLDKIGRKYTLLLLSIPEILPCILIATCNNVTILYIARLIMGIADGALFTSLPVYMGEISEPKVRGIIGASHCYGMLVGVLLINIYGSYVPIRTAACISVFVPLLFLITFVWMPESPYYLVMKNRLEDARSSLKRLRRMTNVEDELTKITADVQRQVSEPSTLRDIFTIRSNLRGFLIILGLRTLQQFSGAVALTYYIQIIFKQADGSLSPVESSIICSGLKVLVVSGSSIVVDSFGRKPLLFFSCFGSAVLLITMGVYFVFQQRGYDLSSFMWFPIICMVLYNVVGAMGLSMIPNLMAAELLSASIKSKALGILNMYLGVCIAAVSKLFQWLDHDFGMHVPFFFFGVWCVVGIIFVYFGVPETKGKTLEEIQQMLKGNTNLKLDKMNDNFSNGDVIIDRF